MESTLIYRVDGVPLTASVDDSNDRTITELKQKCKLLITKISNNSESQATIEASSTHSIHYLILNSIVYMVICNSKFPKKLVFSYLHDVSTEFDQSHGQQAKDPHIKPYQFLNFDSYIAKTKKVYSDSRVTSNLDKLNNDLIDVKQVMTKNIEDLLYRGDSLDKLQDISYTLKTESKKYKKAAEKINFDALIRQYAPFVFLGLLFLFIIYRFFF